MLTKWSQLNVEQALETELLEKSVDLWTAKELRNTGYLRGAYRYL
jgi:hypothetical protein